MKMIEDKNSISYLEEKINLNINLLEIAKKYCEYGYDAVDATVPLISLVDVLLKNQYDIVDKLDGLRMYAIKKEV